MESREIVIRKSWFSEVRGVCVYLLLCFLTVYLSNKAPLSVVRGELLPLENSTVFLRLPLFWLVPAYILGLLLFRIYDVRYAMTPQGLESRSGIISFRTVLTKVRFEDILSIEVVQGLLDRLLDVGIIEISTSATGGVEIIMEGVAAPLDIQDALLAERDRRKAVQKMETETIFA